MFSNKVVLAIKHDGKILRENKDIVALPYGAEFSVLVKNLDNRRLKFKLSIDGADALDDTCIIVNANSETEIKRFIRNGNMNEGNAFKFIERTEAIENGPRGIRAEDGIVRVEAWFEKQKPAIDPYWNYYKGLEDGRRQERDNHWRYPRPFEFWSTTVGQTGGVSGALRGAGTLQNSATYSSANAVATSVSDNEVGITVPGSKVDQKFTSVYGFDAESTSTVIVLRLVGKIAEKIVEKAITVKVKPKCVTCGHLNKATNKFCSECGTAIQLF